MRGLTLAVAAVAVLGSLALLPRSEAAVDDLQLTGRIYLDDGTFLGSTGMATDTPFTVWIYHLGTWQSYPSPTVTCDVGQVVTTRGTCGGWYSIHLSGADKGTGAGSKWEDGDMFYIEVRLGVWPGESDSPFLSWGNGSYYDADADGVYDPGEILEYTGKGNATNAIQWFSNDGWQIWDIWQPSVDLLPVTSGDVLGLMVDGTPYPGPSAVGPTVNLGSAHTISFYVLNQGVTFQNQTTTAQLRDTGNIIPLQTWTVPTVYPSSVNRTGPYVYAWTAPSTAGTTTLCAAADVDDEVNETDEANNETCVTIATALPDLVPQPVEVWVNGVQQGSWNWQGTSTCVQVTLTLTDTVEIRGYATNVATFDMGPSETYTVHMYDASACQGGVVTDFFTVSGLAALNAGQQGPRQDSPWVNPGVPGSYFVSFHADRGNTVVEANDLNNTFGIQFFIGGPDLVVTNPRSAGVAIAGPVVLTVGQTPTVDATTTNNGGQDVPGSFTFAAYESDNAGTRIGSQLTSQVVLGLGAGATSSPPMSFVFTNTSVPGTHYVTFCTDYVQGVAVGVVAEVLETNNCETYTFIVQGPDLTPTNILIGGTIPPACKGINPGDSLTISAQVENVGTNSTGVTYRVQFVNATAGGTPIPPPFLDMVFSVLGPSATSTETASTVWDSSGVAPSTYYVLITVDALDAVTEVSETNNTALLCIQVGGVPDIVIADLNVQGAPVAAPATIDVIAGQVVRMSARVRNDGQVTTSIFSPDFDTVFFEPTLGIVGTNLTGQLNPGETRGPYSLTWRSPLAAGAYTFQIIADYAAGDPDGKVSEDDETNNAFTVTVNVFELPAAPVPALSVSADTVTIAWNSVAGASSYLVYRGPTPLGIDFSTALGDADPTDTAFSEANAFSGRDEVYYVVRAAESHGWRGPTSRVVGAVTHNFPEGYSAFSLPLKPFDGTPMSATAWTAQLLTDPHGTVYRWDTVKEAWVGHAKGLDALDPTIDNFDLAFGESYEIYLTAPRTYRFAGLPATTISHLDGDNGDPRIGADGAFRDGLGATVAGTSVTLTWTAAAPVSSDEVLGTYRVYRSTERGFFDLAAAPLASTTSLTHTDALPSCTAPVCETFYLVLAENDAGRRGGSTFAVAVVRLNFLVGYNHFGLPLAPFTSYTASPFLTLLDVPAAQTDAVLFRMDVATDSWVGHPRGLETLNPTLDNFALVRGEGYTLYLRTAAAVLLIGR